MASLRHRPHCFPLICLSFMFHLLFLSFLLHIGRRLGNHSDAGPFLLLHPIRTGDQSTRGHACCCILSRTGDQSRPRLLLHPFLIEEPLPIVVDAFIDRRWCGLRDTLLTDVTLYERKGVDRTWARLAAAFFRTRARLAAASFPACCCILYEHDGFLNLNNHIWYLSSVLLHFASLLACCDHFSLLLRL